MVRTGAALRRAMAWSLAAAPGRFRARSPHSGLSGSDAPTSTPVSRAPAPVGSGATTSGSPASWAAVSGSGKWPR